MYGKLDADEELCPKLEENGPCPHCGIRNPTGYVTCFSCQMPIDAASVQHRKDKKFTVNMLNFTAQDAELAQGLLRLVEEANRRQAGVQPTTEGFLAESGSSFQIDRLETKTYQTNRTNTFRLHV